MNIKIGLAFWVNLFKKPKTKNRMEEVIAVAFEDLDYVVNKKTGDEQYTSFHLNLSVRNGRLESFTEVFKELHKVRILSVLGVCIPESKKQAISEFIARVNLNNALGFFELNYNNGDLRYNCTFVYDDTYPFSQEIFLRYFDNTINFMDYYMPSILSVIYSDITPEQALNQLQNQVNPQLN